MPRGRLVFPFTVELGLLDTYATAHIDPDGPGPLTSGYDDEFREPVIIGSSSSSPGIVRRVETVRRFPAQIETDVDGILEQMASGNSPRNVMALVFHFADLESAGAVDVMSGRAIIRAPGARLISIRNVRTGELIQRYDESPGFWATQAKSIGYGLGPYRNLLFVLFEERAVSVDAIGG